MIEATPKFKFEYDNSEESQYVRKMFGEKYLQEKEEERKKKLEKYIVELYDEIDIDRANYARYIQLKTKQIVLTDDDIEKTRDIIRDTFKGQKRWPDGLDLSEDDNYVNYQFERVLVNINRPRLGYNGKTHVGPLHAYSYQNIYKLWGIFGRRFPMYKWISQEMG